MIFSTQWREGREKEGGEREGGRKRGREKEREGERERGRKREREGERGVPALKSGNFDNTLMQ